MLDSIWYWAAFILAVLTIVYFIPKEKLFIIWLGLAGVSAFRYKIGPDYLQYERMHYQILQGQDIFEPFHKWLTYLAGSLNANFQFVVVVYVTLIFIFFYWGFRYYSQESPSWDKIVLCLFFTLMFFPQLNGLRQVLVVAMFLYATQFIIGRAPLFYFFIMGGAIFIHKSAVLLIPFYWLGYWYLSRRLVFIFLGMTVIFLFFNPLELIGEIFMQYRLPYADYFNPERFGRFAQPPDMFITVTTFLGLMTLIGLCFLDRADKKENLIFNMLLFFMLIKVMALHMLVVGRLSYYFKPFFLLFLVYLLYKLFKVNLKVRMVIFSAFFALSVLQVWGMAKRETAYRQYSMNFTLFKRAEPIQIFGDYKNVKGWLK